MPELLEQLAGYFDERGWRYQLDHDNQVLHSRFGARHGPLTLAIRLLDPARWLLEAPRVTTLEAAQAAALPALAWHLPELNIAYDPADGEVRVRVWLPASADQLLVDGLEMALALLLPAADLLRPALRLVGEGVDPLDALRRAVEEPPAVPSAADRTHALLQQMSAAADQAAFVRDQLADFDDEVLAELHTVQERARAAGQPDFAEWVEALISAVHEGRLAADPETQQELQRIGELLTVTTADQVAALTVTWTEALAPTTLALLREFAQAAPASGASAQADHLVQVVGWLEAQRAQQPLLTALFDFVNTERWDEAHALARSTPALQEPTAVTGLATLADQAAVRGAARLAARYREHQTRLAAWQANDFALLEEGVALPPALREQLARLVALADRGDRASLEAQLALAQQLAATPECGQQPELWAALQVIAGNSAGRLFEITGVLVYSQAAEQAYHAALTVYTPETMPTEWAMTQNNLGILLQSRYARSGEEGHAQAAEQAYHAALTVRTFEALPTDWATTQHNLGSLLQRRYERNGEERHAQAAEAAYHAALTVRTFEARPTDWAMTQHNLGTLLRSRYERSGEERHAQAAEDALRTALTVYTPEALPTGWAMTQNNLGTLLASRYERSGEERHAQAAEQALRAALTVYTPENAPGMTRTTASGAGPAAGGPAPLAGGAHRLCPGARRGAPALSGRRGR
jgi:hypothetical protein